MEWGRALMGVVLPSTCAGCEGPVQVGLLCPSCRETLPVGPAPVAVGEELVSAWYWTWYDEPVGKALRRAKYRPDPSTTRELAEALGRACAGRMPRVDAVVPVPQSLRAWWVRGFSPVDELAESVGEALAVPVVRPLRRRRASSQAGKERSEREQNVRGTFRAVSTVDGLRVLLVDDIVTTGATARACARELLGAGARSVELLAASRA